MPEFAHIHESNRIDQYTSKNKSNIPHTTLTKSKLPMHTQEAYAGIKKSDLTDTIKIQKIYKV